MTEPYKIQGYEENNPSDIININEPKYQNIYGPKLT